MSIFYYAVPIFLGSIFIEWLISRKHTEMKGYTLVDTAANLSMGVGNLLLQTFSKAISFGVLTALYQFRLFEIPDNVWWFWPLLILCDDFCYYWFHRTSHEVRLFWAGHVNHHSAQSYNLSTALRQSWTSPFYTFVFWIPMPLLGFNPVWILLAEAISLLYQFFIHTEAVDKLGPLEWVFNTPSHHRVHHATNPKYLDRNHGGILIIWDRIFGTFVRETERPTYGLTKNLTTHNLIVVAFHDWWAMLGEIARAKTWRGRLGAIFAAPGWREDGTGRTSAVIRREAALTQPSSHP